MEESILNLVIIGSGPAGCTAAIYACRAGLKPYLVTGEDVGGQLVITPEIGNWPGESNDPSGFELMQKQQEHAKKAGTVFLSDQVVKTDLKPEIKTLELSSGRILKCKAVIIATGAKARYLGVPGEEKYKGCGVSACATCDGFFFRGKDVAVIGGGSAAFIEALYLTKLCRHVFLVHRRKEFRAEHTLIKAFDAQVQAGKAEYLLDAVVKSIEGDGNKVTKIELSLPNETKKLDISGIFVAIGHDPATNFLDAALKRDEDGYVITGTDSETSTSCKGVFAAGDCCDRIYRQAITSAGQGCKAALDAERYLAQL